MSRAAKREQLRKKIKEYRENLVHINEAVAMVEYQIRAERAQIPKDSKELKRRYNDARRDLRNIQRKIDKNKLEATRLKNRIDEIKIDYEHQLEPDPGSWPKLYERVKNLGNKVVGCESAIIALELQKHAAEQAKELALISWQAYKEGVHKKPVRQDPRMKAVLREKKRVKRYLKDKRAALKEI
jgi:chromosome segregation ATPase